jgi:CubicO group peptidase (beta-lactamase class C family)
MVAGMWHKLGGYFGIGLLLVALSVRAAADEINSLLAREMAAHHVSGLACLVIKDGKKLTQFYAGRANLEWPSRVDAATVFEIGSVSKQFAAASILLLAEDGKLSIEDNISKFFTNAPAAWKDIKIRHLLSHTSGIHNYDGLEGYELRQHLTQAQFIERLAALPLDFAPGMDWKYSNSGFNLLGYIVENVSGQSYWDFLQKRIFTPMQMTHTTRRDPWLVIPHRAAGYAFTNGVYSARDYDLTDLFAAGAIVSTVDDLAKWDAALIGNKLLNESSRQQWWTPAKLNNGKDLEHERHEQPGSYGFAWFISTVNGHRNIGHTGITSGFSAANEFYPDDDLTIIILSNTDEGVFAGNLANQLARTLLRPAAK